jgi:hypothetical protein
MERQINNGVAVVLRTIIYYDIFNYPLTESDIMTNCGLSNTTSQPCSNALQYLVDKKIVYNLGEYYSLNDNYAAVERRIKGNDEAKKWLKKSRRFSRLISWFPFVRGISLSGSLSKGFVNEDPDIDYFIITKPNRLWIARTLLIGFKKIFLLNSYKYFCLNYFVTQDHMEIEEKNLFTATEIATMIPVFGKHVKKSFFESNQWIREFFPHFEIEVKEDVPFNRTGTLKRFIEFLLSGKLGDKLDNRFMNTTMKHWSKKFGEQFTKEEFLLSFKSGKDISKHHPQNFQKKVLEKFNSKLKEIEKEHQIEVEKIMVELN